MRTVILLLLSLVLLSCENKVSSVGESSQSSHGGNGVGGAGSGAQGDFNYSGAQLQKALKIVSRKLRDNVPTPDEYKRASVGMDGYKAVVAEYLESEAFKQVMLKYHKNFFNLGDKSEDGVNFNEPANMATYIILNNLDYREILNGKYCVNDNLEKVACSTFANETEQNEHAAGVATTQAFLKNWVSGFNFRRTKRLFMAFACKEYPDVTDEGMTVQEISGSAHQFNCNTLAGCNPRCFSCHRSMNPRSALFYTYDTDGKYNENPTDALATKTDTGEVSTVGDLLNEGVVPRYKGQEVTKLNEYTQMLTQSSVFRDCLAKRFTHYIFGESDSFKDLPFNLQYLKLSVQQHDYKVKPLILDIVSSYEFLK